MGLTAVKNRITGSQSASPYVKATPRYGDNNNNALYKVVSFFSGCGGLDLGFLGGFEYKDEVYSRLPFGIRKAYDNNEKCVETYKSNIGDEIECLSLNKNELSNIPLADVLIGGFPCQDFSS